MAANVAAAACLDHASFKAHLGMTPSTERGNNFHLGVHPKEPKIIYPSGKYIVVRSVEDPSEVFVYRGHNYPATVAKFSPNGYWVASADISGKVRVWSWDNPAHNLKIEIAGLGGAIKDLAWDSESKRIVVVGDGSGAYCARCFTWDSGNNLGEMVGHNKRVVTCDYRATRPFRIMTGSEDQRTIFYAGPPFKLDHSNNDQHSNFVNCVRFSPNGELVASCGSDYKLWLYDGKTGEPMKELTAEAGDARHTGSIYALAWTGDSTHVATAAADKTVKLWDVGSGACVHTWAMSDAPEVGDMQVALVSLTSPTNAAGYGGYQFASVSLTGDINLLKKGEDKPAVVVEAHQVGITALCAVPIVGETGVQVVSGSFDGVVCAWDTASNLAHRMTGQVAGKMHGPCHGNKVSGIALSSAGIVSVGWDDTLRLAPLSGGSARSYTGSAPTEGQPCDVSASSSSDLAAVATNKGVMIFRSTTQLCYLETTYTPTCIALYGEEEVAVGANDNKIYIYSIADGGRQLKLVKQIEAHRGALKAVAYSPDGKYLAAGDAMRMCNVWSRGGDYEAVVQGQWVFHTSSINCLAWSPNSNEVATGGQDENIYVWSVAQPRKRIHYPFAHKEGVTGLMWLSEDELVSAGADHCLARWNVGQDKHKFN